jgi:hypothetical protein
MMKTITLLTLVAPGLCTFQAFVPPHFEGTSRDHYYYQNELPDLPEGEAEAPPALAEVNLGPIFDIQTEGPGVIYTLDANGVSVAKRSVTPSVLVKREMTEEERKQARWLRAMECLAAREECNHECWLGNAHCRGNRGLTSCARDFSGCRNQCSKLHENKCKYEITQIRRKKGNVTTEARIEGQKLAAPVAELSHNTADKPLAPHEGGLKGPHDSALAVEEEVPVQPRPTIQRPVQPRPTLQVKPGNQANRSRPRDWNEEPSTRSALEEDLIAGTEGTNATYSDNLDILLPGRNLTENTLKMLGKRRLNQCWIDHTNCDHECVKTRIECAKGEPIEDKRLWDHFHILDRVSWGKCFEEYKECMEPCKEQRVVCENGQR